jgi:uncharacterized glyoxalase superfamily protein PhnB
LDHNERLMKPTPKDWPRLSSAVFYQDAAAAIDWLCAALGFQVRIKIEGEGGRIAHSELTYGEAVIMVAQEPAGADASWRQRLRSPKSLGGKGTQSIMLYVDDADAHCVQARAHGAVIAAELTTQDYGAEYWSDRSYGAVDPEGHLWWITQRLRDPPER